MPINLVRSFQKRILALNPRPRVRERLGYSWELDPTDVLQRRILIGQDFETRQLSHLKNLMRSHGSECFFDCGANFGLYSVIIAGTFPDIQVTAFEPIDRTRQQLRRNVALNHMESRIEIEPYALSDHANRRDMHIVANSAGQATLDQDHPEHAAHQFTSRETVELRRLDDLTSQRGQRIALKIDVEGHEIEAVSGMRQLLQDNDAIVQIEFRQSNETTLIALMADIGYNVMEMIERDLYFGKTPA